MVIEQLKESEIDMTIAGTDTAIMMVEGESKEISEEEFLEVLSFAHDRIKELNKCPRDLSFFNQQKVALARALINNPTIVLADEPTGELNSHETEEYLELLLNKTEQTVLLVMSNNNQLKKYFEKIFYLKDGNLTKKI